MKEIIAKLKHKFSRYVEFLIFVIKTLGNLVTVAIVKPCAMYDGQYRFVAKSEIMAAKCIDEKLYISETKVRPANLPYIPLVSFHREWSLQLPSL